MEKFKLILFSIVILSLMGLVGYWAVLTIQPGSVHADMQKQRELESKNEELAKQVQELQNTVASLQASKEAAAIQETVATQTVKNPAAAPVITLPLKNQSLINDLQKLINAKILIKEKSQGSQVGTIQTFLNIYNNTSKKVDNDYGAGTKADVLKFQTTEGLTASGEAGVNTFTKMIEWLKSQ